jgi:hypothetical protein
MTQLAEKLQAPELESGQSPESSLALDGIAWALEHIDPRVTDSAEVDSLNVLG